MDDSRLEGESWIAMRDRTAGARRDAEKESIACMELISAAPDLYEALNDLLNDVINFDDGNLTEVFQINATKALAKARGES